MNEDKRSFFIENFFNECGHQKSAEIWGKKMRKKNSKINKESILKYPKMRKKILNFTLYRSCAKKKEQTEKNEVISSIKYHGSWSLSNVISIEKITHKKE